MTTVDRYRVNDALTALASECGVTLDDDTLNELTHHVADVLDTNTVLLYDDGDKQKITREQADRLLATGLAFPNESILGVPDDDGALRLVPIMAYAGDSSPDFPFVADRWMWQIGDQWMAVAEWENEADWFRDTEADGEVIPSPRVRAIHDVPPTGKLVCRHDDGTEWVIDLGAPGDDELLHKAARALWEIDDALEDRFRTFGQTEHDRLGRLVGGSDGT